MRADRCLVGEILGLFELADRAQHVDDHHRLRGRVGTRMPVALRRLVHRKRRLALQIEHEIERLLARRLRRGAVEVDRADGAAGDHALAVVAAAVEVDLVAGVDRLFGAYADARVAPRAQIQIDRILLHPLRAELRPATPKAGELARADRVVALRRQLAADRPAGDQHGDVEPVLQRLGPVQGRVRRADDQQPPFRFERDARHRLRLGQRRHRQQGRDLGRRGARFGRPARSLADVDEADRLRLARILGDVAEQTRFLRARDQQVAFGAVGKAGELLLAELGVQRQRPGEIERARERRGVERHRAVAAADVECLVGGAHAACRVAAVEASAWTVRGAPIRLPASSSAPAAIRGSRSPRAVG